MAKNGNIHPTRIFNKPEELLKAWNEYKKERDKEAKEWETVNYVGKDGKRVVDYPKMPYLIDGFLTWFYEKNNQFIHQYIKNKDNLYDDFVPIVTHMKTERNNSIKTGTLLGKYNASMGNRIVGLADTTKTEVSVNSNIPDIMDRGNQ